MKPETIFEKYKTNLNLLIDNKLIDSKYLDSKDNYLCPVCLKKYETLEAEMPLTLEDAPQKSIGGSKNTLTCYKCNNDAGIIIDHHLTNRLKELDDAKFLPNSEINVKTIIDGQNLNATLKIDKNGVIKMHHLKRNNNPALLEKHIPELKADKIIDLNFIKKKIIPDNLDYAVLKSAFIILFQYTGYKIILSPEYDIIREQILEPEHRIIPNEFFFFSEVPFMKDGIHFVCERDLEIIIVIFTAKTERSKRNFCVFLPMPNRDYNKILKTIFEKKLKQVELKLSAFPENIKTVDYIGDLERIQRLNNWINSF